jgi:all-trans-retinol dehydrogenase (NAD+)
MEEIFKEIHHWTTSLARSLYRNVTPSSWQKQKEISGQLVLVTGAGGVIGRELARKFAELGCRLVLWDVSEAANEETANICRKIGADAIAYVVDITNREAVYETAKRVRKDMGIVDVLLNNAGLLNPTTFLETDDTKMDRMIDVNIKALLWTTKAFLPDMIQQGFGHLVCVSSVAGVIGSPILVDYSASKFAACGFMEALQHQLTALGQTCIHFTTACPIYVRTPLIDEVEMSDTRLPILKPDYVAKRIVNAIRRNDRMLMLPRKIYWLYAGKGILPWNLYSSLVLHRRCT